MPRSDCDSARNAPTETAGLPSLRPSERASDNTSGPTIKAVSFGLPASFAFSPGASARQAKVGGDQQRLRFAIFRRETECFPGKPQGRVHVGRDRRQPSVDDDF